jgi:hypothetical protein
MYHKGKVDIDWYERFWQNVSSYCKASGRMLLQISCRLRDRRKVATSIILTVTLASN